MDRDGHPIPVTQGDSARDRAMTPSYHPTKRLLATIPAPKPSLAALLRALLLGFVAVLAASAPASADGRRNASTANFTGGAAARADHSHRHNHHRHNHHRAAASAHKRRRPAHRAASNATLVIHGAGDGHGVGLSQWGAYGFAIHNWSDTQILRHYYQSTEIGHISKKRIVKVLLNGKVKKVPIEAYVRGVVAAEMPSTWPKAALQAQAIASRTYAITDHAGGSKFDVYSDTRSQMYLGKAAETPASNAAVKETQGQIVTYHHKPAITFFFASSGGRTENVQDSFIGASPQPWLKGVVDPYDQGPLHKWTVNISFVKAQRLLKGLVLGTFKGIEVIQRGFSPRVVSAYILGSKGKTEVSGPELESRLHLDCAWAYFFVQRSGKLHPEPDLSGRKPTAEEEGTAPEGEPPLGEAPPSEAPPSESPSSESPQSEGESSEGVSGPGGGTTDPPTGFSVSGGVKAP